MARGYEMDRGVIAGPDGEGVEGHKVKEGIGRIKNEKKRVTTAG
jgi:hypothetical protein